MTSVAAPEGEDRELAPDTRLHLSMRPPPEPTYRSLRDSRLGQVTPVGRIFVAIGAVSGFLILLVVAAIVMYGLIAGDPG